MMLKVVREGKGKEEEVRLIFGGGGAIVFVSPKGVARTSLKRLVARKTTVKTRVSPLMNVE